MPEPRWLTDRDGRVLVLKPNRPPRHFFDEPMSIELRELLLAIRSDDTIGAVVIAGQGDAFVGHFDVPELLRGSRATPFTVPYPAARLLVGAAQVACRSATLDRALRTNARARDPLLVARTYECLRLMNRMDKVFIAAIDGMAVGMGCILALGCDIRIMADGDDPIGLQESALGMLAAAGGTQRLTRMVGSGRALELLLEGRWLSRKRHRRSGSSTGSSPIRTEKRSPPRTASPDALP